MSAERKMTGQHVFFIFAAFFSAMIIANAAFVYFAVTSYPGETEKKSYLQGLNYNDTLARRAAQEKLGWSVEVSALSADYAELRVRNADGSPNTGLSIIGDISRPADHGFDQALVFIETAPGLYRSPTNTLSNGAWVINGVASNPFGDQFSFGARVIVD